MKTEKCAHCGGDITPTMCQQGGTFNGVYYPLHVGCGDVWGNEQINVWSVSFKGACSLTVTDVESVIDVIREMDIDDEYSIERNNMKRVDYLKLPEFTGF